MTKVLLLAVFSGLFFISCSPINMTTIDPKHRVVKSPNDNRKYKTLTLTNQLEVLLISDPQSDQAAVALDVQTGQVNDPKSRQGLAHFLEHMLFLGNEKYPEPEEFGRFLSAHGGYSNAYTAFEDTNYFFAVQNEYLEGALDRFAQFFISPTFDSNFVEREINAVNSEHNKNIKDDRRRIYRIIKETSNPNHPYHQFATGNLETLRGEDKDHGELQKQLIQYFEEFYSANQMKLVIVGKDPVSQLETLAIKYFSSIENKNTQRKSYKDIPIIADQLPRTILIKPVKSMRQLRLAFPVPSLRKYYRYKPSSVISQLLGDEGEGSVLSYLKSKGWATSLSAGLGFGTLDVSFFGIEMSLTREGLNHTDEIVRTIFQYMELIKAEKSLDKYFNEMKKMAEIGFRFKEKEDPIDYARYLAANMQEVPGNDAVASRWLYEKFRPDLVKELLNYLRVDNLQIVMVNPGVITNIKERWYGAEYAVKPVSKTRQKKWTAPGVNKKLKLPAPNPFIPDNVELKKIEVTEKYPVLLKDTPAIRIWYKQNDSFMVPKANIQIQMASKLAYETVENAAMTKLFVLLLKDQLNEFSYPASIAGLNYSLSNSVNGLVINVNGYSENINLLLQEIVKGMKQFNPDPGKFKIFKNQIKERRQNQKFSQAFQRITYESFHLLSKPLWHTDDYLRVIDQVSISKLKAFIPRLLAQLKIEMLTHGNLTTQDAKAKGDLLEEHFTNPEIASVEEVEEKTLIVPVLPDYIYQLKVEDVNSAIELHYQVGPRSVKQSVTLDMIQQILEKPFYHQLRTIEQLGYLVWSGFRQSNKVEGFYFIIQSGVKDPVYLQGRIENFLAEYLKEIKGLTSKEFNQFRKALIAKRMEAPKNLGEETFRYWSEISTKSYDFGHLDKEISMLKKITKKDVINMYQEIFLDSESERKIAIQAFGKKHRLKSVNGAKITDVKSFKSKMEFYPNPPGIIQSPVYAN